MGPSVIVGTRNRSWRVGALFQSFAQLVGAHDSEFIVVDNASTDDTPAVLQRVAAASPLNVKVLTTDRPGLAYGQNLALADATREILVFTDDDCLPERDWLVQWRAVFAEARVGYGGGRIELHNEDDVAFTINTSRVPETYPPGSFFRPGSIQGANLAFRREVLKALGGFDERFGPGGRFRSGADMEAVARASALGWWGGYFPGPGVSHDHGRQSADLDALLARYAHGRGAYYAKFMLDARTRREFVRHVAPHWRASAQYDRTSLRQELAGVLHFLVSDILLSKKET